MRSGFSRKRVYQCSYGRARAYVGGQNLLTSDVIYHCPKSTGFWTQKEGAMTIAGHAPFPLIQHTQTVDPR